MIIKELELTNIRSHGHSMIRFPLGRTLLEGDIGSGKSSVLVAMEFALFGLGSDSGTSVLRLGQDSGEVRMSFDVDGSEYEVTRRLQRKAGRVQQSDGVLKMPGETLSLSPSELKEKILEILEFNEAPDPKAQSWVYRYAVYTPQEEMKSVLGLASEQRLQILRRAFRVEDYKVAANNAEEASKQIRIDASRQDGIATGMTELREVIERLQKEEEKHRDGLSELEETELHVEEEVRLVKDEREALRKRELSLQGVKVEKEYYERLESEAAADFAAAKAEIAELTGALKAIDAELAGSELERPPSADSLPDLKRRGRTLEGKEKKLTELKAAAETKLSDYESVMRNGVCPVCDRPVGAHDFDERRSEKSAERDHLVWELRAVEGEINTLREKIERVESYREASKESAQRRAERSRLKADLEKKAQAMHKFEKRVNFAKKSLQQAGEQLRELRGVEEGIKAAEKSLTKTEDKLRGVRDRLVRTRGLLEEAQKRQTEIAIEVVAKEEASNRGRKLREREIWLSDYFVPTVKTIEKSVLATVNQEFDSLFRKWFGLLVDDPEKEVRVDEDFSPVVTQAGYEQDVRYLSGGERTSIALAYRLALNVLAQRVSVGMKSNLLILDEPTDGFSQAQLGTVREVLDDVGCLQMIIVSHDKELESFADQIFMVEKTLGESTVRTP
jgi:exonuclease SbcC